MVFINFGTPTVIRVTTLNFFNNYIKYVYHEKFASWTNKVSFDIHVIKSVFTDYSNKSTFIVPLDSKRRVHVCKLHSFSMVFLLLQTLLKKLIQGMNIQVHVHVQQKIFFKTSF